MSAIVRALRRALSRATSRATSLASRIFLLFNQSTQYLTHSGFTPSGVNFEIKASYSPSSAAIGVDVPIFGDFLRKDASNNLVVEYTDTAAAAQTITLSALTLVADESYDIVVSSDGNGVVITVGSDTASNSAVINPSTLTIDNAMGDGVEFGGGKIWNIEYTDLSGIQGGEFLQGDGVNLYLDGVLSQNPSGLDFKISYWAKYNSGSNGWIFSCGSEAINQLLHVGLRNINTLSMAYYSNDLDATIPAGFDILGNNFYEFENLGGVRTIRANGTILASDSNGNSLNLQTLNFNILRLLTFLSANAVVSQFRFEVQGVLVQEYLNSDTVTDNGDGTATAANTGNTGSSFDAIVQNFTTGGLVTEPLNSREYKMDQASAIQPNSLEPGTNDATVVNYDSSMVTN